MLLAGCGEKDASTGAATRPQQLTAANSHPVEMDRYDWNLKTMVAPYETAGFADPAWDAPAKRALVAFASLRSGVETETPWNQVLATNCAQAVQAGCKDPMIEYLYIRFAWPRTNTAKAFADALCQAALDMKPTSYPAIRKFYANRRAVQQFYDAYDKTADRRIIQEVGGTAYYLPEILADPTIPVEEAYDACSETLQAYGGTKKLGDYEAIYQLMEQPMFAKWPDDYRPFLLKGTAHIRMAWRCRGTGYANTVTEEGWKGFGEHLQIADQALSRAWELNRSDINIPLEMMKVELGQGQGRARMEVWFHRAMAIDPNCYKACSDKRYYLEPKWYGSEEDMLAFGWQCLESTNWGGQIPLILVNAHDAITRYREGEAKTNYWKQPEVWFDIQTAFNRFFELNPDATGWYHNYAQYAFLCERWDKFNELLPKLGQVNYDYFGGKLKFAKMVAEARERAPEVQPIQSTPAFELRRVMMIVRAKIGEGPVTEADLADEFRRMDALGEAAGKAHKEEAAQILYLKAGVYVQALGNLEKGKELILRIQRDFPETELAQHSDEILAALDQEAETQKIRGSLAIGKPFPDFDERDLAGKPLSVAGYRGKVLLIDFWATWCMPCVAELPNVRETYEAHHAQGFEIIGVSLDQDRSKVVGFIGREKVVWPQYFDGGGWENKLAVRYGVESIPTTYLLDRNGNIIAKNLRGDALAKAVAKALAER